MALAPPADFRGPTNLAGALAEGVDWLSQRQTLTFVKYVKLILPFDGFVFWVKADQLSPLALRTAALLNVMGMGTSFLGQPETPETASTANEFTVEGSFHYVNDLEQGEAESSTRSRVIFTALDPVRDLLEAGPDVLYLCTYGGLRFSFSSDGTNYFQAGLHHYTGNAVYNDMATQVVDDPTDFDAIHPVVSNSLPLWIALNYFEPNWPFIPSFPTARLYPSFLVAQNILPPWVAVHIGGGDTSALQGQPLIGPRYQHYQLATDNVRLTFYGLRNNEAQDFMDALNQYSLDTGYFGIMNTPIIRDVKRNDVELGTLAQRKEVDFQISYYQTQMRDIARQLILSATVTFHPGPLVAPIIIP